MIFLPQVSENAASWVFCAVTCAHLNRLHIADDFYEVFLQDVAFTFQAFVKRLRDHLGIFPNGSPPSPPFVIPSLNGVILSIFCFGLILRWFKGSFWNNQGFGNWELVFFSVNILAFCWSHLEYCSCNLEARRRMLHMEWSCWRSWQWFYQILWLGDEKLCRHICHIFPWAVLIICLCTRKLAKITVLQVMC